MGFEELKGLTLKEIQGAYENSEEVLLISVDNRKFIMNHNQDCCERVTVQEIHGDINDLTGSPILLAEEVNDADGGVPPSADSYTWTFYKLSTVKGSVTIRWLGESNGCYSEKVSFREVSK